MPLFRFTTVHCETIFRTYEIEAAGPASAAVLARSICEGAIDAEPVAYDENVGEAVIQDDEIIQVDPPAPPPKRTCTCHLKSQARGPVPHFCPAHDGDYMHFLALHNCD